MEWPISTAGRSRDSTAKARSATNCSVLMGRVSASS